MEGFCKACLVRYEDPSELLQYTEKNRRLYVYCTGLQVKPNDTIPFLICQACYIKLKMACQFKKQCRTSDKRLNHFLSLKEAGEETDFTTYLQHTEGSTLFKFPLNVTSTPSYQKPKDDDNVSTSTSMRNFMADFLREDEVPDTEAHIIREMIEQEADVLDDSLDSHWLQEDISIASDFRFSPFSTPLSKHNYQPLLNYSPVKLEPQEQNAEPNYSRKNILAAKKLLLNSKSCSSSQTESPKTSSPHENIRDIELMQKRNLLSAKLLLHSKTYASSQSESPSSQQQDVDEETDLEGDNIANSETGSSIKTEPVDESIGQKSYIARKRMLLKASSEDKNETDPKMQKGKDMETILAIQSIANSKPNSIDSVNEETIGDTQNIPLTTREIYESVTENNINQDVLITHKGFYIESVDANENSVRISDIGGDVDKKDNIDKNIEKLLNNTDDEVISLSALLASPFSETAPAGNNIIATPSVHQGLSGANTPSIENILFGEKLDDNQAIKPDPDSKKDDLPDKNSDVDILEEFIKPDLDLIKDDLPDEKSDVDILEDFFNKDTGKYVGDIEKDQEEIFEEYKIPKLDDFVPGKSQFDLTDFSCKKCKKRYKSERGLKLHFTKVHSMKIITQRKNEPIVNLPCDKCGKIFKFKSNLTRHIKVMHIAPKRAATCKLCSLEFTSEGRLNVHMKIHGVKQKTNRDSEKKSQDSVCPICGHVATKAYNLKVHLARHNKNYSFRCAYCDHAFYRKTDLENHIRKHMNMKPFQCQQCNASFRRKDQLQIHLKNHLAEKPYVCETCNKRFATSSKLKNHSIKSKTCQNMIIEAALRYNQVIEETMDKLYVAETHVKLQSEEILSTMKETVNDINKENDRMMEVTSDTTSKNKENDCLMEVALDPTSKNKENDCLLEVALDPTSHVKDSKQEDQDDRMSLSDIFTIPVITLPCIKLQNDHSLTD